MPLQRGMEPGAIRQPREGVVVGCMSQSIGTGTQLRVEADRLVAFGAARCEQGVHVTQGARCMFGFAQPQAGDDDHLAAAKRAGRRDQVLDATLDPTRQEQGRDEHARRRDGQDFQRLVRAACQVALVNPGQHVPVAGADRQADRRSAGQDQRRV